MNLTCKFELYFEHRAETVNDSQNISDCIESDLKPGMRRENFEEVQASDVFEDYLQTES